jgi:predicted PurR-regulated permease PerM
MRSNAILGRGRLAATDLPLSSRVDPAKDMRVSEAIISGPRGRRVNHRLVAGGVVAALGVALVVALFPFIPGLLGAPILTVIFAPVYRRLVRRVRPRAAAALTIATAILLVLVPGLAIGVLLARELPRVVASSDLSGLLTRVAAIQVGGLAVGSGLAAVGRSVSAWGSQKVVVVAGSAARAAVNLLIAFFGFYYLLVSGDHAWRTLASYSPFSHTTTEGLRAKFRNVTKATLLGIGVGSVVQAFIIGIGFALTGLPNPVLWGVVTGILAVLPMVGGSLVWLSGTIVLFVQHRFASAIALLFIGGVISANVDKFIRPIVSQRVARIHPLVTLVGAFAGLRYMGLPGVLLGPLALAYFFEMLRAFELEFLGAPGGPRAVAASVQR